MQNSKGKSRDGLVYLVMSELNLITGISGVLWVIAWLYIAYNTPEEHPRISFIEKQFIQKSLSGHTKEIIDVVCLVCISFFYIYIYFIPPFNYFQGTC